MTKLLEEAFAKAATLPEAEQWKIGVGPAQPVTNQAVVSKRTAFLPVKGLFSRPKSPGKALATASCLLSGLTVADWPAARSVAPLDGQF